MYQRLLRRPSIPQLVCGALLLLPWPALACGGCCCDAGCVPSPAPGHFGQSAIDASGPHSAGCTYEAASPPIAITEDSTATRAEKLSKAGADQILGGPAIRLDLPTAYGPGGAVAEAPTLILGGRVLSILGPRPPPLTSQARA